MKKQLSLLSFLLSLITLKAQVPTFQWAKRVGGFMNDVSTSMALDQSGNVYTLGYYTGNADFDPGVGTYTLGSPTGGYDIFILKLDQNGNFVWAKNMSMIQAYPNSIATDAAGNIFFTGTFTGTFDFDPGPGTFSMTSGSNSNSFIVKFDSNGNFIWAEKFSGSANNVVTGLFIDKPGNIYTCGYFAGTVDFDPGVGVFNLSVPAGMDDIFITKLNHNGNLIWAKRMGGASNEKAAAVTVNNLGHVYTGGYYYGTCDFDPGTAVFNLTASGSAYDIFVTKLDSAGNFMWAKSMGGASSDNVSAITTDKNGNVITTGVFYVGVSDFDPGPGVYNLTAVGSPTTTYDAYVSKLDSLGNFVWAKSIGGPSYEIATSVETDTSGNIYTTGNFYSIATDFDTGPGIYTLSPVGSGDAYVLKLDAGGNFLCARSFGGSALDFSDDLAIDAKNVIHTVGHFEGISDFNPGPGTFSMTSAGMGDVYIHKIISCNCDTIPLITVNSGSICSGQSFTLAPSGALNYFYLNGPPIVSPTSTSVYLVTGANQPDCLSQPASATVTVKNNPTVTPVSSNPTICPGQSAALTVTGAASYTWQTGATSTLISVNPTVTTTYTVVGKNMEGCRDSASIMQVVSQCSGLSSEKKEDRWRIYPNPGKGNFILAGTADSFRVRIINATGATVLEAYGSHTLKINLQDAAVGMYIAEILEINSMSRSYLKIIKE